MQRKDGAEELRYLLCIISYLIQVLLGTGNKALPYATDGRWQLLRLRL